MHQTCPTDCYSRFRCHISIDPDISNQTLLPQHLQESVRLSRAILLFLPIQKF